jgi:hypothetical protein
MPQPALGVLYWVGDELPVVSHPVSASPNAINNNDTASLMLIW